MYFGGNSEMHGYDYLSFIGDRVGFVQRRAPFPADRSDAHAARCARRHQRRAASPTWAAAASASPPTGEGSATGRPAQPFKWASTSEEVYTPIIVYEQISAFQQLPVFGEPHGGQGAATD
jgi:hypothetical protein